MRVAEVARIGKVQLHSTGSNRLAEARNGIQTEGNASLADGYFEHQFENGLKLLVEPVRAVKSAAFSFLIPGGVAHEPDAKRGLANLVCSVLPRGAGDLDSRAFAGALDNLGVQRSESTDVLHASYTAATLATQIEPALRLTVEMLRRPRLEPHQVEFCRQSIFQELESIEDEPASKLLIELREKGLPAPLGRPTLGDEESVAELTGADVAEYFRTVYQPRGAVLGVAGAVEFAQIRDVVGQMVESWTPGSAPSAKIADWSQVRQHLPSDKSQTHIGVLFPAVSSRDPDFFEAHGAVGVLSGGMSSRLFTEVRERRGLCYSVSASLYALRDLGVVLAHAGTTNERAQETLDVLLAELKRLKDGIGEDEVQRVRAGLKSSLVMQEESMSARASILARSWYNLGRVRTLAEVSRAVDRLSPQSILGYLDRHPVERFSVVTLGPQPLEVTL